MKRPKTPRPIGGPGGIHEWPADRTTFVVREVVSEPHRGPLKRGQKPQSTWHQVTENGHVVYDADLLSDAIKWATNEANELALSGDFIRVTVKVDAGRSPRTIIFDPVVSVTKVHSWVKRETR